MGRYLPPQEEFVYIFYQFIVIFKGKGPNLGPIFTHLECPDLKDQGVIGSVTS